MRTNPKSPAFPAQELNPSATQTPLSWSPTRREYLAAHALQGLLAYGLADVDEVALGALLYADALIKALNGETE